jgi:hypothetical protein
MSSGVIPGLGAAIAGEAASPTATAAPSRIRRRVGVMSGIFLDRRFAAFMVMIARHGDSLTDRWAKVKGGRPEDQQLALKLNLREAAAPRGHGTVASVALTRDFSQASPLPTAL